MQQKSNPRTSQSLAPGLKEKYENLETPQLYRKSGRLEGENFYRFLQIVSSGFYFHVTSSTIT